MSLAVGLFLLGLSLFQGQSSGPPPVQGQQSTPAVVRKDYDMRTLATPSPLSETELKGRRLFVQRCGLCHDPVGQSSTPGPWLDQETVSATREAGARRVIATGSPRMPGFQYTFQPIQIDQIVAYLKAVKPDQKPKSAAVPRT